MRNEETKKIYPAFVIIAIVFIILILSLPEYIRKERFDNLFPSFISSNRFTLLSLDRETAIYLSEEDTGIIRYIIGDAKKSEIYGTAGVSYKIFRVVSNHVLDIEIKFKLDEHNDIIYLLYYFQSKEISRFLYEDKESNFISQFLESYPEIFINDY